MNHLEGRLHFFMHHFSVSLSGPCKINAQNMTEKAETLKDKVFEHMSWFSLFWAVWSWAMASLFLCDPVVRTTQCSCRRPEFGSLHPCQVAHNLLQFQLWENLMPLASKGPCTHFYMPIHRHKHIIKTKNRKTNQDLKSWQVVLKGRCY